MTSRNDFRSLVRGRAYINAAKIKEEKIGFFFFQKHSLRGGWKK